jgi:hypothetical protein
MYGGRDMRIFKSRSSFELVVVLTDAEAVLYREAFRTEKPVSIPELDDRKFMIKEICPYEEEGAPQKSWRLVIKQRAAEQTMHPATFSASDDQPSEETAKTNHHWV